MFPNQEGAGGTGASHINSLLTLTVGPRRVRLLLRFTGGRVIIQGGLTQYNTFPYGSVIHLFFVGPKTTTTVISCIFDDGTWSSPSDARSK